MPVISKSSKREILKVARGKYKLLEIYDRFFKV